MAHFRLSPEQASAFARDGFFIAERLLDADEVSLLGQIARADKEMTENRASRADGEGGAVELVVRNELPEDSIYGAIVRSERIVRAMEKLLGDEVYHYHHKMICKEPRVGGAWAWHQDYGYWYNNGCLFPHMGSCMIAVDEATKANGCLQVLKGSHHIGRIDHGKVGDQTGADPERVQAARERLELVHVELAPGSAVFFHANLLHRSDQNKSETPRWAFICCYNTKQNDPYKEQPPSQIHPAGSLGRCPPERNCSRAMDPDASHDLRAVLTEQIKTEARRLGFDLVGIAPAVSPDGFSAFAEWLAQGYAGEMQYLPNREAAYEHPRHVLEGVKSVIVLGTNYNTQNPPETEPGEARVSRYAWGSADYHDLLRERLKRLGNYLHELKPGCRTRGVVDTAPLLERDFARLAGLGWFGKNTMLINKRAGSWLFLSALLTDLELSYDAPHETAHCGTCTRCLEACPTNAFPEPYVLDARRCISYLTIELKGPIPLDLREGLGEWLFGCDICQDVCPWNRKAPITAEPAFQPQPDLTPGDALEILQMDEEAFRKRFGKTPLARPKRAGLLRNAAIVIGNTKPESALPILIRLLDDKEPLIRGAIAWALGRYSDHPSTKDALKQRLSREDDPEVIAELKTVLEES